MSDEISVKIVGDASGLDSAASQASDSADRISEKLQGIQGAASAGAEGMGALEAAYYSVSGPAQQAAESAKALTDALSSGIPSASAFSDALGQMGTIAAGVLGGMGIANIAGTLKSVLEDATLGTWEWAEGLKNLSTSSGLTTDQLQILQYAAQVTGTDMGRLPMIVNMVARAMRSYAEGNKTVVDAARTLGVDPSKWTSEYDALTQIGERVKELTAEYGELSPKINAATQAFIGGRAGMGGLPAIENLKELGDQAKKSGDIMGTDMVDADEKLQKSINTLKADFTALEHEIGGIAAGEILDLIQDFKNLSGWLDTTSHGFTSLGGILSAIPFLSYLAPLVQLEEAGANAVHQQELLDSLVSAHGQQGGGQQNQGGGQQGSQQTAQEMAAALKAQEVAYKELGDAAEASEKRQLAALGDFQRELKATTTSNVAVETAAAKTVESMYAADFGLQRAQIQELGATHVISAQQTAAQLTALDQRELASKLTTINAEITALQTYAMAEVGTAEKIAALKAQAYALTQEYAAKEVTVQKGAALQVQQEWSEAFSAIGDNMSKVLDIMVTGSNSKTNTMKMQFMNLAQSIEKEMLSSGLKQLLMGGGPIIGTKGMLGGIGGEIANAFSGSAVGAGLKGALSTAWTGLTGVVSAVFGGAWRGIEGIIHSVFGTALQGVASAGAGAATSALGGAGASAAGGAAGATATVTGIVTGIGTELTALGVAITTALTALGISIATDITTETFALVTAITVGHPSFLGFSAAGGAVIPSFGGGGLTGGGALSILHPREMVLPANLSEFVQRAAASSAGGGGGGGGGGNPVNVIFNISALDGNSAHQVIMRHSDSIAQAVAKGVRGGKMTGQGVYRGNFRR